jgi:putative SOS response-associated peptidase YedK
LLSIRFTFPNDKPFCFAGLWQEETKHEIDLDTKEHRFVILTTTQNESVSRVHNRMPLIVSPQRHDWWLNDGGLFETVLNNPYRPDLEWCPVNRALNNVRNEGPELIRPVPIQKNLI